MIRGLDTENPQAPKFEILFVEVYGPRVDILSSLVFEYLKWSIARILPLKYIVFSGGKKKGCMFSGLSKSKSSRPS